MWRKGKADARSRRQAEFDALRASVTEDVMRQVREVLSLAPIGAGGEPNLSALNSAVHNIPSAYLNLKFFGYDLARRLAAALPPRTGTEARHVGLRSKASTQADMESDWVAHWCSELHTPVLFHRKLWELAYVLQALHENGLLRKGARGLGFGCGEEPLPSYLAARGVEVTVTDLPADDAQAAGWARTGQHAASLDKAFRPYLVDRTRFEERVTLEVADMNAIPPHLRGYDFCWSICALEHLGSIAHGLGFIEDALETLKPGGLAVHTTEFNIAPDGPTIDNWPSVLFQRRHFEDVAGRLRTRGHEVAELAFDIGDRPMDRFIDLPPWGHDMPEVWHAWHGDGAHLKVAVDGFVSTCFGMVIRKAG